MFRHLDRLGHVERLRIVFDATRRFPPPWRVRELPEAFLVEDASGQAVACTCFGSNVVQPTSTSDQLSRAEAWRIACGIARLPEQVARRVVD